LSSCRACFLYVRPCFLTLQRLQPRPPSSPPTPLSTLLPPQPSRYASPRHCASFARAPLALGDSSCS
jgi:hypothetical protein